MIYRPFIVGKHDGRAAREYISCISEAIKEKCAAIIGSKDFISVLTDGSQPRKTGDDKEMVLLRVEHDGIFTVLAL